LQQTLFCYDSRRFAFSPARPCTTISTVGGGDHVERTFDLWSLVSASDRSAGSAHRSLMLLSSTRFADFGAISPREVPQQKGEGALMELANEWWAVQVRPLSEKTVSLSLRNKGYEDFLPIYQCLRQPNGSPTREKPLFPGYIFCRAGLSPAAKIITTPGVIRILGPRGRPEPIQEEEIETIRSAISAGLVIEPWARLEQGDQVVVGYGALRGSRGILKRIKGKARFIVSLSLLNRSVLVEIDSRLLLPASLPAAAQNRPDWSRPIVPRHE
jgi:transcription antitermination factor NusG